MKRITKTHWIVAAILDAIIISLIVLYFVGCSTTPKDSYEYHVYTSNGVGYSHLYTAEDEQDAVGYIKFYQKSHGDLQMVKVKK